jgi:hypothetical protein
MALQSQILNVPLTGGLDTKTDPKQVSVGGSVLLENAVFNTLQEIRKRNGYSTLGTSIASTTSLSGQAFGANVSAGRFLAKFNDELVLGDGFNLFSYSEDNNNWVYKGRAEILSVTASTIENNSSNLQYPDAAFNSTTRQRVAAWEQNIGSYVPNLQTQQGVYFSLFDVDTGQTLIHNVSLSAAGSIPRCFALGTNTYIVFYDGVSALKCTTITQSGSYSTANLITDINTATPQYDLQIINGLLYVSYYSAANGITVRSYSSALVQQAVVQKAAETGGSGIGMFSDASNNVWVAYGKLNAGQTDNIRAFVMNSALSVTVLAPTLIVNFALIAPIYVQNITGCFTNGTGHIFWDYVPLPSTNLFINKLNAAAVAPAVNASFSQVLSYNPVDATGANPDVWTGQIVYIQNAGYYYQSSYNPTTSTATFINLGFSGNASPGSAIAINSSILNTSATNSNIYYGQLTIGGVVTGPYIFSRSGTLNSKAFLVNNIPHVIVSYDSSTDPSFFLMSLYNYTPVGFLSPSGPFVPNIAARIFGGEGGGAYRKTILPSAYAVSTDVYEVALPQVDRVFTTTSLNQVSTYSNLGISLSKMDFTVSNPQTKVLGENLHIASGEVITYDGNTVSEQNFHYYPDVVNVVAIGGANALSVGQYSYIVVYEWIDAKGQVNRSAPSIATGFNNGIAGQQTLLSIRPLCITNKQNVNVVIYRTTANGSIYFRLNSPLQQLIANPYDGYISFTDTYKDTSITGNEQLYTEGEVENISPLAPKLLSSYKNRLMVTPSEQDTVVWYSKQVVPSSPVELSDQFVENVGTTGGVITATIQMDDKFLIFKKNSILYLVGDGPSPSGANNDFIDPQVICSDTGCVDANSVILMPMGVMFKSDKGIYIIDRGMNVAYIGARVEAYNQYSVLSAKLMESVNQIRFLLSNGTVLMFDYLVNQWSVFTNHSAVSADVWQDVYVYLNSSGTVFKETPGVFSDNGSYISKKITFGSGQFSGIQGFQRVWKTLLFGEYVGPHTLQVSIAYDFGAVSQVVTIPVTSDPGLYQFGISPKIQKCESLQVTVEDLQNGSVNEGFRLSGFAYEVGVKQGLYKIPAARSYG